MTKKIIAVVNAGSSTLKCALFDASSFELIWKEILENINSKTYEKDAYQFLQCISEKEKNIIAVGHRIVHGGEKFIEPTLLTSSALKSLEKLSYLAPLHNPVNLQGVHLAKSLWPKVPHVGVFDTAFHSTLPPKAFTYPVPLPWLKEGIRRYGFHGISHEACFQQIKPKFSRVITCHLGNGCSLAAIHKGKSIDTTMGFTPMEGLMMGTRSGSIDPGILFYKLREGESSEALEEVLNRKSGLQGLAGTYDMRKVLELVKKGDTLAFDVFCSSLAKGIASMSASLGGVDAIAFTGGIGENSSEVRQTVCKQLSWLGINISSKNFSEGKISTEKSKVAVFVIKAREEWLIAKKVSIFIE